MCALKSAGRHRAIRPPTPSSRRSRAANRRARAADEPGKLSPFAPLKARLARVYLEHKDYLGVPLADDAEIVAHVDEITVLLFDRAGKALRSNNERWLKRYAWFAEIVDDLIEQRPGAPLDG
jgi:hypothetical protein